MRLIRDALKRNDIKKKREVKIYPKFTDDNSVWNKFLLKDLKTWDDFEEVQTIAYKLVELCDKAYEKKFADLKPLSERAKTTLQTIPIKPL